MATYKVLQDIEAEDKLVGPLSLRQFIYACIAALCGYFSFIVVSKGLPFLLVVFLPPLIFCGFFAFPWSREQPTELWALAKIRFFLKPRRRIWDQSGVKELVTVTAPKKIERKYTNGLSQIEVQSRLNALASTIDSRGWAVKNVNVNLYAQSSPLPAAITSDRLVDASSLPRQVSDVDVTASDDMLDEQNNPIAQQFETMLATSSQQHRQNIVNQLQTPSNPQQQSNTQPADYWFLNQPAAQAGNAPIDAAYVKPQVVYPGSDDQGAAVVPAAEPTAEEAELIKQHANKGNPYQFAYSHLKNIRPLGSQPAPQQANQPNPQQPLQQPITTANNQQNTNVTVTPPVDPAKIELARNNDLNISTIARLANKKQPPDDEVVIPLR
jgi:hypothetical protein